MLGLFHVRNIWKRLETIDEKRCLHLKSILRILKVSKTYFRRPDNTFYFYTFLAVICNQSITELFEPLNSLHLGSGCGSVGRAFAFDNRGLRFKSSLMVSSMKTTPYNLPCTSKPCNNLLHCYFALSVGMKLFSEIYLINERSVPQLSPWITLFPLKKSEGSNRAQIEEKINQGFQNTCYSFSLAVAGFEPTTSQSRSTHAKHFATTFTSFQSAACIVCVVSNDHALPRLLIWRQLITRYKNASNSNLMQRKPELEHDKGD